MEIKVEESNQMVVICAQDHFDKAIEVGRKFYQAGVLTLGVLPEYIDVQGCFDAQSLNDGKAILSIVRALTAPAIYSGPSSFDFNDIHTALKDAGKFYARFIYGADIDALISKVADKFKRIDMGKVESVCINLYGELQSDSKACDGIHKVKSISEMMPEGASVLFGIHQLPHSFSDFRGEMPQEMSMGMSFILAGEGVKYNIL
ncbi:MAG: hypothetical protein NC127_08615 [Muribaculum sp.]|nr:hypothetical protein [Muribaculum sp.]